MYIYIYTQDYTYMYIFRISKKCLVLHHPELQVNRVAAYLDLHLSNLNKFIFDDLYN